MLHNHQDICFIWRKHAIFEVPRSPLRRWGQYNPHSASWIRQTVHHMNMYAFLSHFPVDDDKTWIIPISYTRIQFPVVISSQCRSEPYSSWCRYISRDILPRGMDFLYQLQNLCRKCSWNLKSIYNFLSCHIQFPIIISRILLIATDITVVLFMVGFN